MDESCDRETNADTKSKDPCDSGYGSNKSNSQSQRSSGSSKSHQSSLSSENGNAYPNAADISKEKDQSAGDKTIPGDNASPITMASGKRKRKKNKKKLDKKKSSKPLVNEKVGILGNGSVAKHDVLAALDYNDNTKQNESDIKTLPNFKTNYGQQDGETLQVAALKHALLCMKRLQDKLPAGSYLKDEYLDKSVAPKDPIEWEQHVTPNLNSSNQDAFATIVSLDNGLIVYQTPSISNVLGFPKDELVGRNFSDFVLHPKDRMAFATHLTYGIVAPNDQNSTENMEGESINAQPFYCRMRQYRDSKALSFDLTLEKDPEYHTFKMTMEVRKIEKSQDGFDIRSEKNLNAAEPEHSKVCSFGTGNAKLINGCITREVHSDSKKASLPSLINQENDSYLVLEATKLKSAYQYAEEIPQNPTKFVTRHSASCKFGHMDPEAISYLGHLPQDVIGTSVLDYYHPEDMGMMKNIYETVIQEQGRPFRSKPYRFRVFNGTFALLETDWSCFVNPWSWKLEFVIGQHRVVQGPMNPNVFVSPRLGEDEILCFPQNLISEAKNLKIEIKRMLSETVTTRNFSDPVRDNSRRRKDLAALMEALLEQMAKIDNPEVPDSEYSAFSLLERESAMLGEISPHTVDNSGSGQSSECTPPSYNQLNYSETLERFFKSQPKTDRSDESGESNNRMDIPNQSSESDSKSSPNMDCSSGSNIRNSSGSNESRVDPSADGDKLQIGSGTLTQELLTRHNEDMEKFMLQRHKEHKIGSQSKHRATATKSVDESSDKVQHLRALHKRNSHNKTEATHGVKRSGNFLWAGDMQNTAKQPHLVDSLIGVNRTEPNAINFWPPISITVGPGVATLSTRVSYPGNIFNPSSTECVQGSLGGFRMHEADPSGQIQTTIPEMKDEPKNPVFDINCHAPPLIFVQGQQQLAPQQVQLMPAGVIYQPVSSFGKHPSILMPFGPSFPETIPLRSSANVNTSLQTSTFTESVVQTPTTSHNTVVGANLGSGGERQSIPIPTKDSIRTRIPQPEVHVDCNKDPTPERTKNATNKSSGKRYHTDKPCLYCLSRNYLGQCSIDDKERRSLKNSSEGDTDIDRSSNSDQTMLSSENSSEMKQQRKEGENEKSNTNNETGNSAWMEAMPLAPDLALRYTVPMTDLSDVLEKDLQALKIIGKQSTIVDDQLNTLYNDLTYDGLSETALYSDEAISGGSSEDQQIQGENETHEVKRKAMSMHRYNRVSIVHEENAPLPEFIYHADSSDAIVSTSPKHNTVSEDKAIPVNIKEEKIIIRDLG